MKWLADENFRYSILHGLWARSPNFDIVRAQDIEEIRGWDDVRLLAWATRNNRVLLTHDLKTIIPAVREQVRRASSCTPIVLVRDSISIGTAIEQILLLEKCATETDWSARIIYLPFR